MSTAQKTQKTLNNQTFRSLIYRRPLHPELFEIKNRRVDRHGEYEIESWIEGSGHVVRFQVGDQILTEVVVEHADHLPETGLIYALPCIGEKDFEMDQEGRLKYVTTLQTEVLADNIYLATYNEMKDFARETGAQSYEHEDEEDGSLYLSVLDAQKYKREYHIQGYHLMGACGIVLRTQSIFEIAGDE